MRAFFEVLRVYIVNLLLHINLPTTPVPGYCASFDGKQLEYRLNGLQVVLLTDLAYLFASVLGYDLDFFANHFFEAWLAGIVLGVGFAIVEFIKPEPVDAKYLRCPTIQTKTLQEPILDPHYKQKHWIIDFYNGQSFNPRYFGVDIKMMLYTWGASLLHLNIISFAYSDLKKGWNNAMMCYLLQFTIFIVEYCYFENVHLYTYDLFAEKVGFKLLFGCLGFYPFLYCIGGYALFYFTKTDVSFVFALGSLLLYVCGWILTRGPNMQKYYFRTKPEQKQVFGFMEQKSLNGRLLVSGFWALSRHINYFGEIIQSIALALPATLCIQGFARWIPLLYPIYYIALFVAREREDYEVCHKKYGKLWEDYSKQVPWRIVPFVY
ncbi:ergosterol biosynthesis ERG4/ERG24 [Gorgonomyces haynaldii]|nr:ergosterol biosynthesis ERG4/ERG24 [Gorgonomyces haynaldii]